MGKYDRLGQHLAWEESAQVHLMFETVDTLVGGLPASARTQRTWWANNSSSHALAWRAAGWHVATVDLAGRRVTFVRGRVGGTRADRLAADDAAPARPQRPATTHTAVLSLEPGNAVRETVVFAWRHAGPVTLNTTGKLAFPGPLPSQPGIYRLTLGRDGRRSRVYIGESDSVLRRLAGNYRNPGSTQQTSLRVNAELREHLAGGGAVHVDLVLEATLAREGRVGVPLDLRRKAARLLVENVALVRAQLDGQEDLVNLG